MAASQGASFPTLATGLEKYLLSGEYSDMRIKCGDTVHNVHRAIVCAQSPFFANALKKEHNFKESQSNMVELDDDVATTVQAAIEFMYAQDYHYPESHMTTEERIDFCLSVYTFAGKCGIGGLRELCKGEIDGLLNDKGNGINPKDLLRIIGTAYNKTPENDNILRPALIKIASANLPALVHEANFLDIAEAAETFTATLLSTVSAGGRFDSAGDREVHEYICPECTYRVVMKLCEDEDTVFIQYTWCPSCGEKFTNLQWKRSLKG
ncbi:hypothetical protein DIS24_g11929 [Lasiodiplodia hormozganensis]|uniref:BTB domain-containing protein n=1 Tax=Lasiodiplodia hormozganensis TaxID=869390 RepID=A0AA39WG60_9PEZI|nr:hypothetical protein DIS24_g11929 [Lasiodiplodia hormozganensis]